MNDILWFTLVSCLAIFAQAFAGFGGGLIAVPLLVLYLPAQWAIPAYSLMQTVICLLLILEARRHVHWRRLGKWLIGAVVGAPLGSYILKVSPTYWIGVAISVITLSFAVIFLLQVQVRLRDTLPTNVGTGFLSGVLSGSVSQSGPPVVLFSLAQGSRRDEFRATLLAYFFCLSCVTASSHVYFGLLRWDNAKAAAIGVAPAALAATIGTWLKHRTKESFFRLAVLILIIAVSLLNLAQKVFWAV